MSQEPVKSVYALSLKRQTKALTTDVAPEPRSVQSLRSRSKRQLSNQPVCVSSQAPLVSSGSLELNSVHAVQKGTPFTSELITEPDKRDMKPLGDIWKDPSSLHQSSSAHSTKSNKVNETRASQREETCCRCIPLRYLLVGIAVVSLVFGLQGVVLEIVGETDYTDYIDAAFDFLAIIASILLIIGIITRCRYYFWPYMVFCVIFIVYAPLKLTLAILGTVEKEGSDLGYDTGPTVLAHIDLIVQTSIGMPVFIAFLCLVIRAYVKIDRL